MSSRNLSGGPVTGQPASSPSAYFIRMGMLQKKNQSCCMNCQWRSRGEDQVTLSVIENRGLRHRKLAQSLEADLGTMAAALEPAERQLIATVGAKAIDIDLLRPMQRTSLAYTSGVIGVIV